VVAAELTQRFRRARRDPGLTVLEGFHALKHGLRFGAEIEIAVAVDPAGLDELAADLAPDLVGTLAARVEPIDAVALAQLVPQAPRTGVVAIARRPLLDLAAVLADPRPAPVVLLEQPRNMGNMGACVRVAAAADAAAVLTTGDNDPWHPDAVRGAAGLHFALPVAALGETLPTGIGAAAGDDPTDPTYASARRPLLALDPAGEDLRPAELPPRAVLAFGTERHGLSDELLARADARVAIPMRAGVSSLNLATAVAAVLFAVRLRG
jgi:TrmH family RNA methyltransferase